MRVNWNLFGMAVVDAWLFFNGAVLVINESPMMQ